MDHLYKIKALYLGVEIVPESVHLVTYVWQRTRRV